MPQLRSQSDAHQRSLGHLNRKLQQLSRSTHNIDQLTVEQLKFTIELLRALNQLLHTQVRTHTQTHARTARAYGTKTFLVPLVQQLFSVPVVHWAEELLHSV